MNISPVAPRYDRLMSDQDISRIPATLRPDAVPVARRAGGASSMQPLTLLLDFRLYGAWDRGVVQGITELGRERNWHIILTSPDVPLGPTIQAWNASIVVSGCPDRLPAHGPVGEAFTIVVGQDWSAFGVPSICPDEAAIGRMAADHLLRVGVKDTAIFAYDQSDFALARAAAFREQVARAGGVCHGGGEFSNDPNAPNFCSHEAIIAWLSQLPRPCGVFALCDNWANPVAMYCRRLSLRVPEDVALIGVDNDALVCELSSPPLTSVAVPWCEVGHQIVKLIEDHLAGRPMPTACVRVAPLDVVARRSTDTLSIDNQQVAEAVGWIRRNAHRMISVDDVLRAVPTYRQRLERQFRAGLGRTVMEEVRRAHIDLAKSLLKTTDLPMPEIAARSGFSNATLLGVNFRKEVGITPSDYRRRSQGDAANRRPPA